MDTAECYQLLEIEPTDSLKEIKQAYRDIVFVWHPDRMAGNTRVQEKAENKLKRINAAYEKLQTYLAHEIPKLRRIVIFPQEVNLEFGESYTFSAIGFDQNGNEVELEYVTWSVSNGGTIYAEGSFFADYEHGTFTVTATSEGISNTATIFVKPAISEATKNSEQDEENYENSHEKGFNPTSELTSNQAEADVGFPWKRLIFWGLLTPALLATDSQDPSFGLLGKFASILLLAWIIGLIRPKTVFKFGLPNTRASVTQIYLCLPMLLFFLTESDSTVWEGIRGWVCMLWFVGMINPKATINFGFNTRGEVTGLYILLGLVMGGIWGVLRGI